MWANDYAKHPWAGSLTDVVSTGAFKMKARYYAANDRKSLLKVLITLGKPEIEIHLADNELNWNEIKLNKEQADGLVKFITESPRQ